MMTKASWLLVFALFLLPLFGVAVYCLFFRTPERWVVYYDHTLPAEAFLPYDVIVFDREGHPPLAPLRIGHKTLLAYVSLGEAETYRDNYQWVKDRQLLLATDAAWKGNPVVDVRNPEWSDYLLGKVIPQVIAQGFDGVMLDTADSVIWLEKHDPVRYAGLQKASAMTIKQIHARYPQLRIMLNRGFEMLPLVAGDIDMILAESIYPRNNVAGSDKDYRYYIGLLDAAKAQSPHLKIYTLDYYQTHDATDIRRIYRAQRSRGYIPYVTLDGLQALTPEPQ